MVTWWYVRVLESPANNVADAEVHNGWRLLNVGHDGRTGEKTESWSQDSRFCLYSPNLLNYDFEYF